MNTPFGPVINLGTLDNPNYAGSAGGVAYLRGIHTAFQALSDLEIDHDVDPMTMWSRCVDTVEALLTKPSPPSAPEVITVTVGRDPNTPT